jgi:hypothetical protein
VDSLARDQEVDDGLSTREVRDDPRRERNRGLGALLVRRVDIDDDGDASEELLLVLADDRLTRSCPAPRVEVTDRVARAIRADAEELHRLTRLRREGDAAGLIAPRLGDREAGDAREAGEHEEARSRGLDGAPLGEAERHERGDVERVDVMRPPGDEPRAKLDPSALTALQPPDAGPGARPAPVPRQEGAGDPQRVDVA